MGGPEKALHQQRTTTTNELQQTNDNERTTNYIDDDNSPPGFFQNPRANNVLQCIKTIIRCKSYRLIYILKIKIVVSILSYKSFVVYVHRSPPSFFENF